MPSGPKPISGFNDGSPPQAADDYVFERANVTYRIPYATLQAAIIAAVTGTAGRDGAPAIDGIDAEEPMMIPGQQGIQGLQGNDGITTFATTVFFLPPDDPEDVFPIPGSRGVDGAAGIGTIGRDGAVIWMEPELPDDPMMIPGIQGLTGPAGTQSVTVTMFLAEVEITEPDIVPGPKGDKGDPGGGGGGGSWTATTITLPYGYTQYVEVLVTDAAITAADKIFVTWGTITDADENTPDMDDVEFNAVPGTGSMVVRVSTVDPLSRIGGAYKLMYLRG